jgi:hypothetical protein
VIEREHQDSIAHESSKSAKAIDRRLGGAGQRFEIVGVVGNERIGPESPRADD